MSCKFIHFDEIRMPYQYLNPVMKNSRPDIFSLPSNEGIRFSFRFVSCRCFLNFVCRTLRSHQVNSAGIRVQDNGGESEGLQFLNFPGLEHVSNFEVDNNPHLRQIDISSLVSVGGDASAEEDRRRLQGEFIIADNPALDTVYIADMTHVAVATWCDANPGICVVKTASPTRRPTATPTVTPSGQPTVITPAPSVYPTPAPTVSSCRNGITIINPATTYDCTEISENLVIDERASVSFDGSVTFPSNLEIVEGVVLVHNTVSVATVNFPNLLGINTALVIEGNGPTLTTVNMPSVFAVGLHGIYVEKNEGLQTLDLQNMGSCASISIKENAALESIDISSLTVIGDPVPVRFLSMQPFKPGSGRNLMFDVLDIKKQRRRRRRVADDSSPGDGGPPTLAPSHTPTLVLEPVTPEPTIYPTYGGSDGGQTLFEIEDNPSLQTVYVHDFAPPVVQDWCEENGKCVVKSESPTYTPTAEPTNVPTSDPTFEPTNLPSQEPSFNPTVYPTTEPTESSCENGITVTSVEDVCDALETYTHQCRQGYSKLQV